MSFIAKHIIGPDERLIGVARPHWIYVVTGLFWAMFILFIGMGIRMLATRFGMDEGFNTQVWIGTYNLGIASWWFAGVFNAIAASIALIFYIKFLCTEVGLTTQRVIRKSGLIAVEVMAIDIGEIDAANVNHGLLGSLWDYGAIHLDCRFVGDVDLPKINRPYVFLRALQKLREPATPGPAHHNQHNTNNP